MVERTGGNVKCHVFGLLENLGNPGRRWGWRRTDTGLPAFDGAVIATLEVVARLVHYLVI
jgi:hypothetical protein